MGKLGRFACIFTPVVLTIISFLLLLVALIAGWNRNDGNLSSLYHVKFDTTAFKQNVTKSGILSLNLPGTADDNLRAFLNNLLNANSKSNLKDVYNVYLWNYCAGSKAGNGTDLTFCSPRQARYWFNPIEVWGLNSSTVTSAIPKDVQRGLNIYKTASQWLFVAYAASFFATVATLLTGLLALCSRWGSCCTTLFSSLATLLTFLTALTSTIVFPTLAGAFNTALKTYGIKLDVGGKALALAWIAFVFSIAATLFWSVSMCCCSGKSERKRSHAEKSGAFASRGYQPIADRNSYYGHQQGAHMQMGALPGYSAPQKGRDTGYEPFRQV